MKDVPITLTTIRPLRVVGAVAAGGVALLLLTTALHAGGHHYRLWRAGGVWCATMAPDGTVTESYGVEACGQ
ncbi:hypothetical protein [Phormidium sp. FACHB-1136]|uniref:hypothetical protein n=1 Tax=Phormidium sp. FACHB-1136 TaxID=2692848 RepID=UPI001683C263|nr:hypothetical protein [Phormidium sp. FACHB-1136]MBD2425401.1 hypothetical protein [Phormidium sp. FACHB-1136]